MRYLTLILTLSLVSSVSFGSVLSKDIATIANTSGFDSKVKVLDPKNRIECSNEINLAKNSSITITSQQLSCTGDKFRIKVYGLVEMNAKTSSVFSIPANCTVHVDKLLDDRFHIDCH